jgi:hypothetical protein
LLPSFASVKNPIGVDLCASVVKRISRGYAMLAGARADYVGKVILKYGLLTQGGVR